jgi:hypothetical protein
MAQVIMCEKVTKCCQKAFARARKDADWPFKCHNYINKGANIFGSVKKMLSLHACIMLARQ